MLLYPSALHQAHHKQWLIPCRLEALLGVLRSNKLWPVAWRAVHSTIAVMNFFVVVKPTYTAHSTRSHQHILQDPYSRPSEKRGGAWMDEVVGRSRLLAPAGESVRLPVAHMVCNQTPPVGDKPSLMTFRYSHHFPFKTNRNVAQKAGIRCVRRKSAPCRQACSENLEL